MPAKNSGIVSHKVCAKCKTDKVSQEFIFSKMRNGFSSWCRECSNAWQREYWKKSTTKEKEKENRKKHIKVRRERSAAYMRKVRAEKGDVYQKNRIYQKNRVHVMRALRAGNGALAKGSDFIRIGEAQKWKCPVCKDDISHSYQIDHVVPITKGGDHSPHNIQLLCKPCNLTKGSKDPVKFMQEMGHLL